MLADEAVQIKGYGPARQITLFEDDAPVLQVLTSDTTATAAGLLSWLRARWRIENMVKYAAEHNGIDALADYRMDTGPDTRQVTNPARTAARKPSPPPRRSSPPPNEHCPSCRRSRHPETEERQAARSTRPDRDRCRRTRTRQDRTTPRTGQGRSHRPGPRRATSPPPHPAPRPTWSAPQSPDYEPTKMGIWRGMGICRGNAGVLLRSIKRKRRSW